MKRPDLTQNKILLLLAVGLLAAMVVSVTQGRYPIGLKELGGILVSRVWDIEPFWTKTQESLLLQHRLPRLGLACLVGGSLACAGAAYQGVFQNPMAAPDILGASSGAAFGAALAILLKLSGTWIMVLAFCGSLLTVLLVMLLAGRARGKRVLGLILAGIMVSSLISSGTSLIKLVADPEDQLPAITYWLMGSLNGTAPGDVWFVLVPMALGLVPLFLLRWRINLLTLGDDEARTMGVHAKRLRAAAILTAGGKGNAEKAHMHLNAFFRMLNARGFREHMACSANTDTIPADRDEGAKDQVAEIARWLNAPEPPPEFTGFQACGCRKE